MNKYMNIFKITFLSYVFALLARPYVTAQFWADICFIMFIMSVIYQVLYLVYFRKRENLKFIKVLFIFFIYAINSVSIYIIFNYINIWFKGFTPSDVLGNSYGNTYYGLDAIKHANYLIFIPYFVFNIIILMIYNLRKKGSDNNGYVSKKKNETRK